MVLHKANQKLGITSFNKTFTITTCFLLGKTGGDIAKALNDLKELHLSIKIVVLDGDNVVKNVVSDVYPLIPTILYA